jgi:aminopeptidase N
MADQLRSLDQRNPITASRMAKVFSRWRSYGPSRQQLMRSALQKLRDGELSNNSREVVDQCLGE